jgi:O-antigen/teichoic acid export membrane protein
VFWPKHNDVATHEDPGWWPSLRGLRWYSIPIIGSVINIRAWRRERNGLIVLRSVLLGLLVTLFLFLVPLSFVAPWDGGDEGWVPWVLILIGIVSLAQVASIRRRSLPTTSPEALARLYRAWFFIGVSVASAAALWGFVGVFLGGSLWIYLVGLAFGLVGLWMIAPTRSDIERRQREITTAGSPLSLLDALISVPRP